MQQINPAVTITLAALILHPLYKHVPEDLASNERVEAAHEYIIQRVDDYLVNTHNFCLLVLFM